MSGLFAKVGDDLLPLDQLAWAAFEPCGCCTGVTVADGCPTERDARNELADLNELPASSDGRAYQLVRIEDVRSGAVPLAWDHDKRCPKATR